MLCEPFCFLLSNYILRLLALTDDDFISLIYASSILIILKPYFEGHKAAHASMVA